MSNELPPNPLDLTYFTIECEPKWEPELFIHDFQDWLKRNPQFNRPPVEDGLNTPIFSLP